jgi:hypothetical protein
MSLLKSVVACGSQDWQATLSAKLFNPRAIVVAGVQEMVERVVVKIGPYGSINELCILDHGEQTSDDGWVQLGSDRLHDRDVAKGGTEAWRSLANLRGLFADEGYLFFMNCGAGQSPSILRWAAGLAGTRVYGGTGYEHAAGFNDGYYVVAWPDGTIKERVPRPQTTIASAIFGSDPATAPTVGRSMGEKLRDLLH